MLCLWQWFLKVTFTLVKSQCPPSPLSAPPVPVKSKKLPTRRSISSVGSGAERTAMGAGHSAPSTHPQLVSGDWTTYRKIFQIWTVFTSPGVEKTLPVARGLVTSFSARRLELDTLSYLCLSQVTCWTCCLKINLYFIFRNGRGNQVIYL